MSKQDTLDLLDQMDVWEKDNTLTPEEMGMRHRDAYDVLGHGYNCAQHTLFCKAWERGFFTAKKLERENNGR